MKTKTVHTEYASADRASSIEIEAQHLMLIQNETFLTITNSIPQQMVVLNKHRQIVYANERFIENVLIKNKSYLGQRVGEALQCTHSNQSTGGCGTTEFCSKCGAVNAMLEAQRGNKSEKECRITTFDHDALDLKVSATPYHLNGESFIIFIISDISHEKRREILERVFFHDILNSAGGVAGLTSVLSEIKDLKQVEELAGIINTSAQQLVNEILEQRQLISAETSHLEISSANIDSLLLLEQIKNLYIKHEISDSKFICIDESAESIVINTDPTLLKRILGNMIKNALEASSVGQTIRLSVARDNNQALFSVHNHSYINHDTQLQLFKRSFTTKGAGRGLGTYSMKLFGEKYLKGKVWFKSTPEKGTTFFIELPISFAS